MGVNLLRTFHRRGKDRMGIKRKVSPQIFPRKRCGVLSPKTPTCGGRPKDNLDGFSPVRETYPQKICTYPQKTALPSWRVVFDYPRCSH
jgi:hypothetical protein